MLIEIPCHYCGQYVLFADPNVTLAHLTICPPCLQKHYPKAAKLLHAYNRRTGIHQPVLLSLNTSPYKHPSIHSK